MKIEHYSFGQIVIGGKTYASDIIVYPDRVDPSWRRREGHYLQKADLADIVAAGPEVLVIGTGSMGVMQVPQETVDYLEKKNILVIVEKTAAAVERFNKEESRRKTVGAFHLTC